VLAVSETLARRIGSLLGLPDGSVGVIPNVVDVTAFRPVGAGEREPDELLWVGSRQASKGTDVLLEAFGRLRSVRPALRLRLIGPSHSVAEEARLRALARDLGVGEAVAFEPAADRAAVAAAMARAAVFVHPSPLETFGVVAVEALASGLPVAATPSGGVDEIVGRDGRYGVIAASTDAAALADAIALALDRRASFDPDVLRARADENYAAPVVVTRILDVYRALVPDPATGVRQPAGSPEPATGEPAAGEEAPQSGVPLRAATASPVPASPPLLVLGLRRRTALTRIAFLPQGLAGSLHVLTSAARGGAKAEPDLPAGPAWTFVEADAAFFEARRRLGGPLPPRPVPIRLLRAARHPLRDIRLRLLARRRAGLALHAQRDAISAVVARLRGHASGSSGGLVEVLAIDADDVVVLAPLIGPGLRLHPGTLRSLADRWDASERPELPPDRLSSAT
jgi:hypothetical protein